MSDVSSPWSAAVAEVRRRVQEGRDSGRYPEELDEQLASQFARAAKDPLYFEALDAFGARLEQLADFRFSADKIATSSDIAGGSQIHRVVAKVVARQIRGVLQQADAYATGVTATLRSLRAGLDEIRAVVTNDVFGDIDAVHHRLVSLEHRLARLEAAHQDARPSAS